MVRNRTTGSREKERRRKKIGSDAYVVGNVTIVQLSIRI